MTPQSDRTQTLAADHQIAAQRLADMLLASLTALAGMGDVEAACRLAGQACVALRSADPAAARKFYILLHRLTPMLRW